MLESYDGRHRTEASLVELAYRSALASWASGSLEAGRAALADLEARFAGSRQAGCLSEIEENTYAQLTASEPQALLAVLAVHVDVWRSHVGEHRYWLAFETRERLERWLDVYVAVGGAGAGERAADLLLVWVMSLIASGYVEGTGDLLAHAHRLGPDVPEVLLLNAWHAERTWSYGDALPLLERLLELRPGDDHARLRYGVNLARSGRGDDAFAVLAALTRATAEDWMRELAYGELARLEADRERLAPAIALLQEGFSHFPDSESLAIQLAYYLRRRDGRPSPLTGEILKAWTDDTGIHPRLRYEQAPRRIGEVRSRLAVEIERRLPVLHEALNRLRETGGSSRPAATSCRKAARLLR